MEFSNNGDIPAPFADTVGIIIIFIVIVIIFIITIIIIIIIIIIIMGIYYRHRLDNTRLSLLHRVLTQFFMRNFANNFDSVPFLKFFVHKPYKRTTCFWTRKSLSLRQVNDFFRTKNDFFF